MKHRIFAVAYKVLGLVLCGFFWQSSAFPSVVLAYFIGYAAALTYGSMVLQSNFYIRSTHSFKGTGVAVTFDDGPHPIYTPKILDVLKEKGVKSTFFLIGSAVEKHPEIAARIVKEGHVVGNHSFSHKYSLPFFSSKKLRKDFDGSQRAIKNATGCCTRWIRPPFGATSPRYFNLLRKRQWASIGWSLRSLDTTKSTPDAVVQSVLAHKHLKEGAVVLLHDNLENTAKAMPALIDGILQKGMKIASLQDQISNLPYERE